VADRISRHELRRLLLDAGADVLLETGMPCGLDNVTFARAFDRIQRETGRRITRASVYDRLWANQAEYQWDVLATVVEASTLIDPRTVERIERIIEAADRTTPAGREACLHELCQLAVEQHVIEASDRQSDRIITAALGAIASVEHLHDQPAGACRVRQTLSGYLERQTQLYTELYLTIGAKLGYRLRAPLELRHFVLAVNALGDGIAMRANFFPEYRARIDVPPLGGDGPVITASLASLGVEAIARSMLELDPDWPGPDAG
jgi:hypothetical protein